MLNLELLHKRLAGVPAAKVLGEMRSWLMALINRHMTHVGDKTAMAYLRVSVQEMQVLQQSDPQRCFRFL